MAGAVESVKIGTVIWIGYGPYYVADALDLYKKSGLKVTLQVFSDPALIPPAIEGGTVDGGMLTYDQVIGVVAKGSTQRVVSPIDYSAGGDAIVSSVDIKKVADFKGKKVGFNPLSPSDFLLSYALKTNKLTEKGHRAGQHDAGSDSRGDGLRRDADRRDLRAERVADHRPGRRKEIPCGLFLEGCARSDHRRDGVQEGGHQGQARSREKR